MPGVISGFDAEEALEILAGLLRTPSENPTGSEEKAGRYVHELLRRNGIPAELSWAAPGRPNVVARLKGREPGKTLLLNGHLDTVPAGEGWSLEPYAAIREGGRLYGRGASDMKAGVAGMAYAAILLQRMGTPFAGELMLFFNSDEERTNLGMHAFLDGSVRADFAVIGEPTDLDVCTGHRGVARFWVTTHGVPGHTSFVRTPDNAISKMVRLAAGLEVLGEMVRLRADPLLGQSSLTVAEIHGGTAPNIVPGLCRAHIDRRTLPGERRDEVVREVDDCLSAIARGHGFSYDLDCYQFLPASCLDHGHCLVRTMAESARVPGSGGRRQSVRGHLRGAVLLRGARHPHADIRPGEHQARPHRGRMGRDHRVPGRCEDLCGFRPASPPGDAGRRVKERDGVSATGLRCAACGPVFCASNDNARQC
jgi:acetylornithine deacetylase/succinyl-diaminopimelate desuccinylase-like protein